MPTFTSCAFVPPDSPTVADAAQTALRLPWAGLVQEIEALLRDDTVTIPPRTVLALPDGAHLFVMSGHDARVAMTKLITLTPANKGTGRPTIQGDVVVFDVHTGQRRLLLDGPTVTARRTAAVSLLAAQRLARHPQGPLLIVGAGVQGLAHLQAFIAGLSVRDVLVASRSAASAQALVDAAQQLGARAQVISDIDAATAQCPLIVTCTPAQQVVLHSPLQPGTFLAAVGAFTPSMVELSPALCQHAARHGQIVVDSPQAVDEAGDLLQAGLQVHHLPTLADIVRDRIPRQEGPVLFKSCGWAGWDLAAARMAMPGA